MITKTSRWLVIGLIAPALLLAGCLQAGGAPGPDKIEASSSEPSSSEPQQIECSIFGREQPGESLEGETFRLERDAGEVKYETGRLTFNADYSGDAFEGWRLLISVTETNGQAEVVRQLYQIDSQKGLRDQFIGGHGFTGLVYVYLPGTTAEMQYFCAVGGAGE